MPNDNEGVLFKNEKKREGKKDADYAGQITVDGKEYWLNAWVNTSKKSNMKFFAIKARLKSAATSAPIDHIDSEIPF